MSQGGILSDSTSGAANVEFLTGNSGGPVGPDAAFNINVLGTGSITVAGNAGTNTLTAQLTGLTNHSILVGSGTATITSLGVGTNGQLLVGSTGTDPSFGSSASADFTFTSVTAGDTRTLTVSNTDNTNAASTAAIIASTGGASSGDAIYQASTTTTTWSFGVDNSVTSPTADPFVISQGTVLGTNNVMSVATSGEINYPLQPAFLATLSTNRTNVTGDGTPYIVIFDTEVYDQNSDFNLGTSIFTAPVTGKYNFKTAIVSAGWSGTSSGNLFIITSNRNYSTSSASTTQGGNGWNYMQNSSLADMDAADTCTTTLNWFDGTLTVDIQGSSTSNFFCGTLEC